MKATYTLAALAVLVMTGCGNSAPSTETTANTAEGTKSEPIQAAYALGSVKKGDSRYCIVCVKDEGKTEVEPVAETIDYQGKTYAFCNEGEKATFISDPSKYAAN